MNLESESIGLGNMAGALSVVCNSIEVEEEEEEER